MTTEQVKTPLPAVSARAQAAYDAFWASPALGSEPPSPLGRESPGIRAAWEAAARGAVGPVAARMLRLADEWEKSANENDIVGMNPGEAGHRDLADVLRARAAELRRLAGDEA